MRLSDLRARVRSGLNDPSSVYWSDADIDAFLQEAQEVYAEEAQPLKRTVVIPRRPATAVYSLHGVAPSMMVPYRIWLPDLHRRLTCVSLDNLDARHQEWLDVSGDPWWWAPVDWRQFVLWPVPAAGGWLEIDYYSWPSALQAANDSPDWRESQHPALVAYAEFQGFLQQWEVARASEQYVAFAQQGMRGKARQDVEQTMSRGWARTKDSSDARRP